MCNCVQDFMCAVCTQHEMHAHFVFGKKKKQRIKRDAKSGFAKLRNEKVLKPKISEQ